MPNFNKINATEANRERRVELARLLNTGGTEAPGTASYDGISFTWTDKLNKISLLQTSLANVLLDAVADWNALEDEISQLAVLNKWQAGAGFNVTDIARLSQENAFATNQGITSNTPRLTFTDTSQNPNKFFQWVSFSGGMFLVENSPSLDQNPRGRAPVRVQDGIVYLDGLGIRQEGGRLQFLDGSDWRDIGVNYPTATQIDIGSSTTNSTTNVTSKRFPSSGNATQRGLLRKVWQNVDTGEFADGACRIEVDGTVIYDSTGATTMTQNPASTGLYGAGFSAFIVSEPIEFENYVLIQHRSTNSSTTVRTHWDIQTAGV